MYRVPLCLTLLLSVMPASARELPSFIFTPAMEIANESTAGGYNRLAFAVNLRLAGLNTYIEPRVAGGSERHEIPNSHDSPEAGDLLVFEGFVGKVVRSNQTESAVGLQNIESQTTRQGAGPGLELVTTTTTIKNRRGYEGIATVEQWILEGGVLSDIYGTAPDLGRIYWPAVGFRFHENFDNRTGERVNRHIVWTLHVLGPEFTTGADDLEREDEGPPLGLSVTWETAVFKTTNFVARFQMLPGFAGTAYAGGLKWPLF